MRVLIFTFDQWDDDKGAGWDSYRGAHNVPSLEAARVMVARINDGHTEDSGYDDYQIVDADNLCLIERGKLAYEWAADGNTVINSEIVS